MDDTKYVVLPLKTIISFLHERNYTNPMIAKGIGVTPLQVHYYHRGTTKAPKPDVCMKLLTEFTHQGKHMLVDLYKDYGELHHHVEISKD